MPDMPDPHGSSDRPDPLSVVPEPLDLTGYLLPAWPENNEPMAMDGERFGLEMTSLIIPVFSTDEKLMDFLDATDAPLPCLMSEIEDGEAFVAKAREIGHLIIVDPEYSEDPGTGHPILHGFVVNNPEAN